MPQVYIHRTRWYRGTHYNLFKRIEISLRFLRHVAILETPAFIPIIIVDATSLPNAFRLVAIFM